jgi:hypothetical protein
MKRRLIGALLLFLVLAAAGCQRHQNNGHGVASAGGTKSAGPQASARPSVDQAELARLFQQCMKDQGVDVQVQTGEGGGSLTRIGPGPSSAPTGAEPDPKKIEAAMQKCKQYAPNGGEPPKADPARTEAERKFAKCMRDNGVANFPDPDPNGGTRIDSKSGIDPNSDTFKAAQQKCQSLLPGPGSSGGPVSKVGG